MARRLGELPETKAALEAGELSEDQAAVVCKRAPAHVDAEVATFARSATVTQLRRVLSSYSFETPLHPEGEQPEEPRRVSFGYTDEGSWSLSALLPPDEGAMWERALSTARDELFRAGEHDDGPRPRPASVSWADALVAVADRSLAPAAAALCSRHHRMHHLGKLGISGNADEPGGLVFTDERGRSLAGSGPPTAPGAPLREAAAQLNVLPGSWTHPTGEALDRRWVYFHEPRAG